MGPGAPASGPGGPHGSAPGRRESGGGEDAPCPLDQFAYVPRAAAAGAAAQRYGGESPAAPAPAPARFSSHLARAGSFAAGAGRLAVRPQLPSARAKAALPVSLDLLAFRRS